MFKKDNQNVIFNYTLGFINETKINTNDSYLVRGYLVPSGDFLYTTWKLTTYYYRNVMPQWKSINKGNWLNIEKLLRQKSAISRKDFVIITGTYGVLTLKDIYENDAEMYLGYTGTIPVPKFSWKIAYEPIRKSAVVFVVSNNPFFREVFPCKDICKAEGLFKKEWSDVRRGLVSCCTYSNFRYIVNTSPNLVVRSTLKLNI